MRRMLGVAVALIVVMPGIALAQSPRPPIVAHLGPAVRADDEPPQSTPPPAAWRRVKPGREVWVTTNTGSLVHGKIAAISDSSLSIREQDREVTMRLDEVRLVEGRDNLENGTLIGAASGAVAGAVSGGYLGREWWAHCGSDCGDESHEETQIRTLTVLGAVGGAIVGGLLGMTVDGLIHGRQTLFGANTIVVTPVITPTGKALNVAIRWR